MGFMFILPFIMFPLVFMLVCGVFVYVFVRMIKDKKRNDNSPRLTVEARVIDKRTASRRHSHSDHHSYGYSCYVTFEFDGGERAELYVPSNEYGLLVVGDVGSLTLQGTRFIGFERKRETGR